MEDSTDSIKPMKLTGCCEDSGFHCGIIPSMKALPSRTYSLLYDGRVRARKSKPGSCTIRLKKKNQGPPEEIEYSTDSLPPPQESEDSTDSSPSPCGISVSSKKAVGQETGSSSCSCSGIYGKRKLIEVYDFVDTMDETDNNSTREIWNGADWFDEFCGDDNSVSSGFSAMEECGGTTLDASPESCTRKPVSTKLKLKVCDVDDSWDSDMMEEVESESDTGCSFSRFLITKKTVLVDFSAAPNVAKRFKSCSCGLEEEI